MLRGGAPSSISVVDAALYAGMSALWGGNTTLPLSGAGHVEAQQRYRPDNDGSTGKFTQNWSTPFDKKIPWPVKAARVFYESFAETWQAAEAFVARSTFRLVFQETWQASEAFFKRGRVVLAETWQASEDLVLRAHLAFAETWQAAELFFARLLARISFEESTQKQEALSTVYHAALLPRRILHWIKISLGIH